MSSFQGPAYSVLHPTDFSATSEIAFAHALAVAIRNKANLTILHVSQEDEEEFDWKAFPSVRKMLEQWGVLEAGSRRRDVGDKVGIEVNKVVGKDKNIVNSIVGLKDVENVDLMVMGTRKEHQNWLLSQPSTPVAASGKAQLPTLFVPGGGRSCVDLPTGEVSLSKVLLAVDREPDAQPAISRIVTMLRNIGGANADVVVMHVGNEQDFPEVNLPSTGEIKWSKIRREGTPAKEICQQATEMDADLIVMVTAGKRNLWDFFTGSTLQNVLKSAPCPVFTLPGDA